MIGAPQGTVALVLYAVAGGLAGVAFAFLRAGRDALAEQAKWRDRELEET